MSKGSHGTVMSSAETGSAVRCDEDGNLTNFSILPDHLRDKSARRDLDRIRRMIVRPYEVPDEERVTIPEELLRIVKDSTLPARVRIRAIETLITLSRIELERYRTLANYGGDEGDVIVIELPDYGLTSD